MLLFENGIFIRNSTAIFILLSYSSSSFNRRTHLTLTFKTFRLDSIVSNFRQTFRRSYFHTYPLVNICVGRDTSSSCTEVYPELLRCTRGGHRNVKSYDVFILYTLCATTVLFTIPTVY